MFTKQKAKAFADALDFDRWSEWLPAGKKGVQARVKLAPDYDSRLEDSGDWFGTIHFEGRHSSRQRPSGCNGAARKITTRDGYLWWQPPADVLANPEALASLEKRVRGYYGEQWDYVGVVLEVKGPACSCCTERKTYHASLWGIESDAGDYFAEVLRDLSAEAFADMKAA